MSFSSNSNIKLKCAKQLTNEFSFVWVTFADDIFNVENVKSLAGPVDMGAMPNQDINILKSTVYQTAINSLEDAIGSYRPRKQNIAEYFIALLNSLALLGDKDSAEQLKDIYYSGDFFMYTPQDLSTAFGEAMMKLK